jgi:hypothetical protein
MIKIEPKRYATRGKASKRIGGSLLCGGSYKSRCDHRSSRRRSRQSRADNRPSHPDNR